MHDQKCDKTNEIDMDACFFKKNILNIPKIHRYEIDMNACFLQKNILNITKIHRDLSTLRFNRLIPYF